MLQFSSSQFSNLRWRYFVESLLLKSTPNVSSVVLSSARVAGVDRADARASSVAREPPREDRVDAHRRGALGGLCSRPPGRRHCCTLRACSLTRFLGVRVRANPSLVTGAKKRFFRRRCARLTTAFARVCVCCAPQVRA